MQALLQSTRLAGTTLRVPRTKVNTQVTRSSSASGEGLTLTSAERLWEIGGRYWWPFKNFNPPSYLDGTLPGDRGFDPLRLGELWGEPPDGSSSNASRLGWLFEGELYNGRVCMLAVLGVLIVELQGKGPWFEIVKFDKTPGPKFAAGIVALHIVFAFLEKKRIDSFEETGEAGHLGGAPFDPAGIRDDYKRQSEVRNGRTAMLATLGFWVQAYVTGKGPLENAFDHYTNPYGANVFTYGQKGQTVAALFIAATLWVHLAEVARLKARARGEN